MLTPPLHVIADGVDALNGKYLSVGLSGTVTTTTTTISHAGAGAGFARASSVQLRPRIVVVDLVPISTPSPPSSRPR